MKTFRHMHYRNFIAAALLVGASNVPAIENTRIIEEIRAHQPPEASQHETELAFDVLPYLKEAYISASPVDRKDNIAVGKLGVDGGDKNLILQLADNIAKGSVGDFDSLLIFHKNQLLFESYYLRGRINLPHFQASATKTYVSLAIGRAIQLGYLTMADLDKPLISFLKHLDKNTLANGANNVTLHKVLTMQSGIRIDSEKIIALQQKSERLKGQSHAQMLLEKSAKITTRRQIFHYQDVDPQLIMQVLEAVVPGSAKDFIKNELLKKLGITTYYWEDDVSGLPTAPYASGMTSRDMLKWGMLIKNKGQWNGVQLVSKNFIEKAIHKTVYLENDDIFFTGKNVVDPGYGYYFWLADMIIGDKHYSTVSAQGGGGQYIILIDELDLIVIATAHERGIKTMQITAEHILPAFLQ